MNAPTTPAPPVAERRRWSLAVAMVSVAVFGLSVGQAAPLISLLLETRGIDATLNGLSAATTSVGIVLGPWLAQRGIRLLGISRFLLLCFALDILLFLSMKLFDGLAAWFVLRFLLGLVGSNIFTASEAWINSLAGSVGRGRIVGLYGAMLSAGFGIGPLLLALTGIDGWAPFIANTVIVLVAMIPLLAIRDPGGALGTKPTTAPWTIVARAPVVFLTVLLFGVFEMALMVLLPVWGLRSGLGEKFGAATLSAIYLGAITLQVPIGFLSDRIGRLPVLQLCGAVGLVGALLLATQALPTLWLFALLFVWGGTVSAIYVMALSMAGDRFSGSDLVSANAALISVYGLGSLTGPVLGGVAMDYWNPQGLPAAFAVLFAAFLLMTWRAAYARS